MKKLTKAILVSSLALAAAGLGGCLSIKVDGEVREDVSYRVGFEDGIEVVSFDTIEPLVTTNGAGCWVAFYAVGDFVVDDGKVAEMAYDKYMSIGILPLFAKTLERADDAVPGFYIATVLYDNILMLGLPTICGIFVNPFVDNDWVNRISMASVAGVVRYGDGNARVAKRLSDEEHGPKPVRRILMKDFAISVNGVTWIKDQDGAFLINAREPEEVSIAFATIPKKPQEISSQLKYSDWLGKQFTIPGKTFRGAIDGEIAPSRSQSTIGGTKSCGGHSRERQITN